MLSGGLVFANLCSKTSTEPESCSRKVVVLPTIHNFVTKCVKYPKLLIKLLGLPPIMDKSVEAI